MVFSNNFKWYFTDYTLSKGLIYFTILCYVIVVSIVVVLEGVLIPNPPCHINYQVELPNPLYNENPCRHTRYARLLFLTSDECSFGRRLVTSVILGSIVGWERRENDRPAGIRTMALVSLGSCLFTITSSFNFLDGPMNWDASRIAAAIPSGVGFLGAGLIFKDTVSDADSGISHNVVHGLTTSASLWISAAVGVACAGQLYFAATFTVALILTLLRFGPRQRFPHRNEDDDNNHEDDCGGGDIEYKNDCDAPMSSDNHLTQSMESGMSTSLRTSVRYSSIEYVDDDNTANLPPVREDINTSVRSGLSQSERKSLLQQSNRSTSKSFRARASLSGIL